nr:ribosome silencing factor [Facklamia lactis]
MVKAADDRLAQDIVAMDVSQLTPLAEYFLVMHARNDRQLVAIMDEIIEQCRKSGIEIKGTEGKDGGKWVLMDINDIVVHLFHYQERSHYNIEKVWVDAPLVDVTQWVNE